MKKLSYLRIGGTDIDSGLEYLPKSLNDFTCILYRKGAKVKKIIQEALKFPRRPRSGEGGGGEAEKGED